MSIDFPKPTDITDYSFSDFPIGSRAKVITRCVDFRFFHGDETGVIEKNNGSYLGIILRFDAPLVYKYGDPLESYNFNPENLMPL